MVRPTPLRSIIRAYARARGDETHRNPAIILEEGHRKKSKTSNMKGGVCSDGDPKKRRKQTSQTHESAIWLRNNVLTLEKNKYLLCYPR